MDNSTFNRFREIVYQKSGISLGESKRALVSARIGKRMRALGLTAHRDYLDCVVSDSSGNELVQLLDVISTNVTSFYREAAHFEFLGNVVREWYEQGLRRLRVWCAASSTGEEAYTIAMTVLEAVDGGQLDFKILATDISTRVLEKCRLGLYEKQKIKPVPPMLLKKYFTRVDQNRDTYYQVREQLKDLVVFTRLNLSTPPFPMKGPFDVVFCRNVMIYFDKRVRSNLLQEMHRLIKPGGYLLVGHAEGLSGISTNFKSIRPAVYYRGDV